MEIVLGLATLLGGITAIWFFWDKISAFFAGRNNLSPHDIELYEKYKALFIENGVAEFYKQHDFLAAFKESNWLPLCEYVDSWDRVEYEFVDKTLNASHKKLYSSALKLGSAIAKNTVPIGPGRKMRSVKSDRMPDGPTPDYIKREAQEINELCPEFSECHESFIRLANSKLQ